MGSGRDLRRCPCPPNTTDSRTMCNPQCRSDHDSVASADQQITTAAICANLTASLLPMRERFELPSPSISVPTPFAVTSILSQATDAAQAWRNIPHSVATDIQDICRNLPVYCCIQDNSEWQVGRPDGSIMMMPMENSMLDSILGMSSLREIATTLPQPIRTSLNQSMFRTANIVLNQSYMLFATVKWLFVVACILPPLVWLLRYFPFSRLLPSSGYRISVLLFLLVSFLVVFVGLMTAQVITADKAAQVAIGILVVPGTMLYASGISLLCTTALLLEMVCTIPF